MKKRAFAEITKSKDDAKSQSTSPKSNGKKMKLAPKTTNNL